MVTQQIIRGSSVDCNFFQNRSTKDLAELLESFITGATLPHARNALLFDLCKNDKGTTYGFVIFGEERIKTC